MYTINPNKNNAIQARTAHFEKVKKSIDYLVRECASKLRMQDGRIDSFFDALNKLDRFFPELHSLHHFLQTSMRNQDVAVAKVDLVNLMEVVRHYAPFPGFISVSSVTDAKWEKFVVGEAIKITSIDCGLEAEINSVPDSELLCAKDILAAALCAIARNDPDMFDEIQEHVQIIKLFKGKSTMGFTDVRILGAMLIRLPRENIDPVLYLLEHVVHEASHIHLNCVMAIDPLILNSSDEKFVSPLRPDPRPMIGVFHATYVSARIARIFMKLYQETGNLELLHPLAETLDETLRGIVEIEKNAKLTPNGSRLISSIVHLVNVGKSLPEWSQYNFTERRIHRFGSGITRVTELMRAVA